MATLNVAFLKADNLFGTALGRAEEGQYETLTTSGTTGATTIEADTENVVRLAASGGDMYIAFGATPEAAVGEGILLLDGNVEYFTVATGSKVAAIDAA